MPRAATAAETRLPGRASRHADLGRLVRGLPTGDFTYEPIWDGFRCVAFRTGEHVDLRSRNDRPLARYFPELVAAFSETKADRFVLDGRSSSPQMTDTTSRR